MTDGAPVTRAADGGWSNADADRVVIAAPDPAWPARFAEEADALRRALGAAGERIVIEHVGSTAVPGLAAKPIIDILLVPPDGAWPAEALAAALPPLGYAHWADDPDPAHMFFVKGMPPHGAGRTHHVHVRPAGQAAPVLAFRNQLRANPALAAAYMVLKRELARRHPTDREAYTRGKDAFVAAVLRLGEADAGG